MPIVPSCEPPSATTIWSGGSVCACSERSNAGSDGSSLSVGTTTASRTRLIARPGRRTGRAMSLVRLAVVVPTLNEEPSLPALLRSLQAQTEPPDQIVVADGGSHDGTIGIAQGFGAQIVVAPGRGR